MKTISKMFHQCNGTARHVTRHNDNYNIPTEIITPPSIFILHIRRMTEGNIFTLFTLAGGGGVPHPANGGGYPISGLDKGVPLSQVWMGGYPIPGVNGGTPCKVRMGGNLSQVWIRGTPSC